MRFVVLRIIRPAAARGGFARAHAERCASRCKIEGGRPAAWIKERPDVIFNAVVSCDVGGCRKVSVSGGLRVLLGAVP
eukprot:2244507-Pleurochrysis_carterae.AAC.1